MSKNPGRAQADLSSFSIEPVQTGDIRAVMRLAWKTTSHLYPAIFFEEIANRQREYFRVVREDTTGRIVGFVIAARQPGRQQNFMLLAVEPNWIGHGVRRALLREVQAILKSEGVRSFSVEVPASDSDMLLLYRREGFDVVGVEEPVPGEMRTLVAKELG
ncbi:MAG TPA: GNAT family N-acetyltransferase [Candidatus Thermoplasmatota archaeon]